MSLYFDLGFIKLPAYGSLITLGAAIAVLLSYFDVRKKGMDPLDLILLAAYGLLGGFIGAKGLFLIVSAGDIDWSRFFEAEYFNQLMMGGFVFYGGIILAMVFVFIASKVHHIKAMAYLKEVIWTIPLAHAFGRMGCFMAGCCHGMEYHGPFAVVFPEGSMAPAGIPLFPSQLFEAIGLLLIFLVLLSMHLAKKDRYTVPMYMLLYGVLRFILEYFRGDAIRGIYGAFSTSQWISIGMVAAAIVSIVLLVQRSVAKKGTD